MKINLDLAIMAIITTAILSFTFGALYGSHTPFNDQQQLEQQAIRTGHAVEV